MTIGFLGDRYIYIEQQLRRGHDCIGQVQDLDDEEGSGDEGCQTKTTLNTSRDKDEEKGGGKQKELDFVAVP